METKTKDVYFVSDLLFETREQCAHCQSKKEALLVDEFGSVFHAKQGEIVRCPDCMQITIVLCVPYYHMEQPALVKWPVPSTPIPIEKGASQL